LLQANLALQAAAERARDIFGDCDCDLYDEGELCPFCEMVSVIEENQESLDK
jgi:hypothetical protein